MCQKKKPERRREPTQNRQREKRAQSLPCTPRRTNKHQSKQLVNVGRGKSKNPSRAGVCVGQMGGGGPNQNGSLDGENSLKQSGGRKCKRPLAGKRKTLLGTYTLLNDWEEQPLGREMNLGGVPGCGRESG